LSLQSLNNGEIILVLRPYPKFLSFNSKGLLILDLLCQREKG
jgi:hypothetical protein